MIAIFANAATSWSSRKQMTNALSTTESKLVALSEATRECLWQKNLFAEIECNSWCKIPTFIFADNQGAISLAEGCANSERTKHIDVNKFCVQEEVRTGRVKVEHQRSHERGGRG